MLTDLLVFLEFHSKWVFAILVYQTFLFSVIFFYWGRWSSSRPNLILSLFMLIAGIIFLAFLFQHTGKIALSGTLNVLLPGGFLMLMPAIYLYLRIKTNHQFRNWISELLHFAPAALILLINLVLAIVNQSARQNFMHPGTRPIIFILLVQTILWGQFIIYSYQTVKLLNLKSELFFQGLTFRNLAEKKWLILLFLSCGLFSLIMVIMVLDSMLHNKQTDDIVLYIISFIVTTILIALFSIKQKNYFQNAAGISDQTNATPLEISGSNGGQAGVLVAKNHSNSRPQSQPDDNRKEELIRAVSNLISEKAFIDPEFSLEFVAKKINSNSKYVSQVINESTGMPFINYVNELRIAEAKKLLSKENAEVYSLEGIGQMVGYQSKSTFNTHFKKLTGMTPGEYLKEIKK